MFIKTEYKETTTVKEMMVFFRGNQSEAARHLGVNRCTLRKYLVQTTYVFVLRDKIGEVIQFSLINGKKQYESSN